MNIRTACPSCGQLHETTNCPPVYVPNPWTQPSAPTFQPMPDYSLMLGMILGELQRIRAALELTRTETKT